MKHTTAAIAIASLSAAATPAAASSSTSSSTSTSTSTSKSGKSGVGVSGVCTAADFTGGWKGGVFCGSVASVTDDTAVNDLFNGCHPMPRSYADTNNTVLEIGNVWEMAVALEANEDGTLKFRPINVFNPNDPNCLGLGPSFLVNGYWFDDCTFMATIGSRSPSNTYTGRHDKATNQLVVETSNYDGVNRNFLSIIPDVEGTINARLNYFGPCYNFCGGCGI